MIREITFSPDDFYANYFWSVGKGYKIREDILVKTYLSNFFTFKDIMTLHALVGEDALLAYAEELGIEKRVRKLVALIEKYA